MWLRPCSDEAPVIICRNVKVPWVDADIVNWWAGLQVSVSKFRLLELILPFGKNFGSPPVAHLRAPPESLTFNVGRARHLDPQWLSTPCHLLAVP